MEWLATSSVLPASVFSIWNQSFQIRSGRPLVYNVQFYIQARDEFANNGTESGGQFLSQVAYLDGPLDVILAAVTDLNQGTSSASFTPTGAGKYAVFVRLDGIDVLRSPYRGAL